MKYSLNDIEIMPSDVTGIEHRSECIPYHCDGMLPLFTAPMSSVVGLNNYELYKKNKINPIIPRTENLSDRLRLMKDVFSAFSLSEFDDIVHNSLIQGLIFSNEKTFILIDIANGHMSKLHSLIKESKDLYGDKIVIMAGNIANPETYKILSECGADYVRLGIGTGSVCITSSNTGIHFPLASLIKECYDISLTLDTPAFIVADGGIKGYADITKCLVLGADYVMCGSIFNKMLESSGETFLMAKSGYKFPINQFKRNDNVIEAIKNGDIIKSHYGMSTKRAQSEMGCEILKTSEGIEKIQTVEYTMLGWVNNFEDYLKSLMSYCSAKELYDLIGEASYNIVSSSAYNSINK